MKTIFRIATVVLFLLSCSFAAREISLPPVQETFTRMHAGAVKGKTISAVLRPEHVQLIALTKNGGNDWNSNQLIGRIFSSNAQAQEWGLSATERVAAEYSIVIKTGELFVLEILSDFSRPLAASAVILRGNGFGCRFDMK